MALCFFFKFTVMLHRDVAKLPLQVKLLSKQAVILLLYRNCRKPIFCESLLLKLKNFAAMRFFSVLQLRLKPFDSVQMSSFNLLRPSNMRLEVMPGLNCLSLLHNALMYLVELVAFLVRELTRSLFILHSMLKIFKLRLQAVDNIVELRQLFLRLRLGIIGGLLVFVDFVLQLFHKLAQLSRFQLLSGNGFFCCPL
ncbi:hypothetical protein AC579_6381 [Pseudocercospora musae]|uniref:Uncharacterized protein n=1 Tax=Pseudocercospora musae TaxID=113226 RepID=A0A139IJH0_9PEZI|nr:hypothetical protein AC579_6381 [Pseudocercospora musae]